MDGLTKKEAALVALVLAQKIARMKMGRVHSSPNYRAQMPVLQSAMIKLDALAKVDRAEPAA